MKFPVSIAILDYAPVIATLIGQVYILKVVKNRTSQFNLVFGIAGLAAVFSGGFLKATWKLIMAVHMIDYHWMENSLFICMAPGFCLMAFAVWNTSRVFYKKEESGGWWIPTFAILAFMGFSLYLASTGRKWNLPLIALLTISYGIFSFMCFKTGRIINAGIWSWLFIISFIIALIMAGISRLEQTLAIQWLEESINTFGTSIFALAAWKLNEILKHG